MLCPILLFLICRYSVFIRSQAIFYAGAEDILAVRFL
jgi:hypothetical protein